STSARLSGRLAFPQAAITSAATCFASLIARVFLPRCVGGQSPSSNSRSLQFFRFDWLTLRDLPPLAPEARSRSSNSARSFSVATFWLNETGGRRANAGLRG